MKKKILLIQSTQTQGNGTKHHLEDRGYKVVLAGSGLTALMLARNMTIDLILLDVALPDVEGMDLCRRFRQRSDTHGIPIILLTARGYRLETSMGVKYRPDAYLAKPFAESELDEKISLLLAQRATEALDKKTAANPQPAPALITVSQEAPKPEIRTAERESAVVLPHAVVETAEVPPVLGVLQPSLSPLASVAVPAQDEVSLNEAARAAATFPDAKEAAPLPILPFFENSTVVIDPETGLFGRPQFEAMLNKEFKRAVRFKQNMSLMLIDIDGRSRGQIADEALVKAMIELVQKTIREVDTPAWWSGESFIVLLPNTSSTDALQAAARILESVALHPFSWPDATRVTMNIGVAGLPDAAVETQVQLLESATAAVRRAQELMAPPPFDVRSLRR